MEPRSSCLKGKRKGEGEMLIKEFFVQDMMKNNDRLHILGIGAPVVLLPQNYLTSSIYSKSQGGFQPASKSRLFPSFCSPDHELRTESYDTRKNFHTERKQCMKEAGATLNGAVPSSSNDVPSLAVHAGHGDSELKKTSQCEQGLFSCVTCGILCFACVAIVQPTETAACWLMSADCCTLKDLGVSAYNTTNINGAKAPDMNPSPEFMLLKRGGPLNIPICSAPPVQDLDNQSAHMFSNNRASNSSLGLLALTYGNSSDSEEANIPIEGSGASENIFPEKGYACGNVDSESNGSSEVSVGPSKEKGSSGDSPNFCMDEFRTKNCTVIESNALTYRFRHQMRTGHDNLKSIYFPYNTEGTVGSRAVASKNTTMSFSSRSDEDSSRLHVFCLQHAVQVEKQLRLIGGAYVFLVCHPDYPKLESNARKVAELEADCLWSNIMFREATEEDENVIRLALDSENAIHGNGDWAVKMGINLFYSASLSRSPLYCKQMPYNFVIYNAFGRGSLSDSPSANVDSENKASGRPKKIAVAGKWCGKVWMSSQAHPLRVNASQEGQKQESRTISSLKPDLRHVQQLPVEIAAPTCRTKNAAETRSCMYVKSQDTAGVESVLSTFCKRKHGATRLKKQTSKDENLDDASVEYQFVNSENSSDMNEIEETDKSAPSPFRKRKRKATRLKKEAPEGENLDKYSEELQVVYSCKKIIKISQGTKQQFRKQSPEDENLDDSSEEFALTNSWKLSKSNPGARPVKMKIPDLPKNKQRSKKQLGAGWWAQHKIAEKSPKKPRARTGESEIDAKEAKTG